MGKAVTAGPKGPPGRSIMSFFGAGKSSPSASAGAGSRDGSKATPEGEPSCAETELSEGAAPVAKVLSASPLALASAKPPKPAATAKAKAQAKAKAKAGPIHSTASSGTVAPDVVSAAHKLIDLAKDGAWDELYSVLNCERELVNIRPDVREYGVLHQAAFHGNNEAVDILIDTYGADPTLVTKHGETVVDVAKSQGNVALAERLAARLAADLEGASPEAKRARHEDRTPEKLSKKAPVPVPSLTPDIVSSSHNLLDLAKHGDWKALYKALDKRPELINVRPAVREYGILHQAAYCGDEDMVRALIEKYGADPQLQTKSGESAVSVAKKQGHTDLVAAFSSFSEGDVSTSDDADNSDFDFVQMPDGTWKVVPK